MCSQYALNWRECTLTTAEMVSFVLITKFCELISLQFTSDPLPHFPVNLDMNSCLTEVLVKACVSPALLSERFGMLHAILVAILHRNVGSEIGKCSQLYIDLSG